MKRTKTTMLQLSETMNKVKILIVEQGDTFEFSQVERPKKKRVLWPVKSLDSTGRKYL